MIEKALILALLAGCLFFAAGYVGDALNHTLGGITMAPAADCIGTTSCG